MDELLHRFNPWWTRRFELPGIPRESYISTLLHLKDTRDVVLVTGLRRAGKTTLMYQLIHNLLGSVDPERIFYVSLDSMPLREYTILDIVEGYRNTCGLKHDDFAYLFLDEVHMKKDYELQLKNIYDAGGAKIYASGSSSLDVAMKSPHLTGRQRLVRMSPLSFNEYLTFTGKEPSPADQHLYPGLAEEYVETGGMPEYVKTRDQNYLQSLVDAIIYRDIAARHGIRNTRGILDVLSLVAQSVGSPISLRKISKVTSVSKENVNMIIDLFVEANLVHMVEREGKLSERKVSPRKMYLADTGLFNVLTENVNYGSKVENAIYLALRQSGVVRYYRHSNREVDFVRGKEAWESKYRNVTHVGELPDPGSMAGFKSITAITKDTEGETAGVTLVPLWKFLLQHTF